MPLIGQVFARESTAPAEVFAIVSMPSLIGQVVAGGDCPCIGRCQASFNALLIGQVFARIHFTHREMRSPRFNALLIGQVFARNPRSNTATRREAFQCPLNWAGVCTRDSDCPGSVDTSVSMPSYVGRCLHDEPLWYLIFSNRFQCPLIGQVFARGDLDQNHAWPKVSMPS